MDAPSQQIYEAYYLHGQRWGADRIPGYCLLPGSELDRLGWAPMMPNWSFPDLGTGKLVRLALGGGDNTPLNSYNEPIWVPRALVVLLGLLADRALQRNGAPIGDTLDAYLGRIRQEGKSGALRALRELGILEPHLSDPAILYRYGAWEARAFHYRLRTSGSSMDLGM